MHGTPLREGFGPAYDDHRQALRPFGLNRVSAGPVTAGLDGCKNYWFSSDNVHAAHDRSISFQGKLRFSPYWCAAGTLGLIGVWIHDCLPNGCRSMSTCVALSARASASFLSLRY